MVSRHDWARWRDENQRPVDNNKKKISVCVKSIETDDEVSELQSNEWEETDLMLAVQFIFSPHVNARLARQRGKSATAVAVGMRHAAAAAARGGTIIPPRPQI